MKKLQIIEGKRAGKIVMDKVGYSICETQQEIYRDMALEGYDMKVFSDAYLSSDFVRRAMDTTYSRFQTEFANECADFFLPEIESKLVKLEDDMCFSPDVAEWIGFTYRQLYIETGVKSSELIKIIPFELMCKYYPGLHTLDEEMALDIFLEYHKSELKKGV